MLDLADEPHQCCTRTERELAAIAASFVDKRQLTPAETRLIRGLPPPDPAEVESCRALMKFGLDPLGESFLMIRTAEQRREAGAIYTPEPIVRTMVGWAANEDVPVRVVDPGTGSGRFIAAAAEAFPEARLVACDVDPLALLLLRATAVVRGFHHRLEAVLADYRELKVGRVRGKTLFIGNPPYVRHHRLSSDAKTWFATTARRFGYKASKLAGLHAHFFLRTRELAQPGDFGAFITSAEWLDVNYGSVIRQMLGDGLGGTALHLMRPESMPFGDTMTTGVITCFRVGQRPSDLMVREVASVQDLESVSLSRVVPWADVRSQDRWSGLAREPRERDPQFLELGELFRVHRGAVTGNNSVFIEGAFRGRLPPQFLVPAVTKARELFEGGPALQSSAKLRRVITLPPNLTGLTRDERAQVDSFLHWARANGAAGSFTARTRGVWWAVKLREPAPILCTYMARRAPAFVRNLAGARHINIAHGIYPRVGMTAADLDAYAAWLSEHVCIADGRTYAGGLTKFEPKEIERIRVPCLKRIRELYETPDMDRSRTRARRSDGPRSLSC